MLELKKTMKKNRVLFGFSSKMGKTVLQSSFENSFSTGVEPATLHARSRPPAYSDSGLQYISVGFCTVLMLHCQTSTSTVHDDSSNVNEEILTYNTFHLGLNFELNHSL